jgi:hypothetical protein
MLVVAYIQTHKRQENGKKKQTWRSRVKLGLNMEFTVDMECEMEAWAHETTRRVALVNNGIEVVLSCPNCSSGPQFSQFKARQERESRVVVFGRVNAARNQKR